MTPTDHLNAAIAKAGGVFAFCRSLNVTHQAIYNWKRRGAVPLERAAQIEKLYGTAIGDLVKESVADVLASVSASSVL